MDAAGRIDHPVGHSSSGHGRRLGIWLAALLVAIAWAAYVGFRLPNLWSVTFYNVTWFDGAARRAFLGTVLAPVWAWSGYRYTAYAVMAFVILAGLLVVIVGAALRAQQNSQRIIVLTWLIAPTGAYLFHEVGYLDQVVYLLLFASLWMWSRTGPLVAVLPVVASVLVHELALLTTWPILVWWAWRAGVTRRQAWVLLTPGIVGTAVLLVPPLTDARAAELVARLMTSLDFSARTDVVALYARTQSESWALYSPFQLLLVVLPFVLVIALGWLGVWLTVRPEGPGVSGGTTWALCGILAPFLLVFGGADMTRWIFFGYSNLAIVGYLWISRRNEAVGAPTLVAMLLPFVMVVLIPLPYFDDLAPRSLSPEAISRVIDEPDFLRLPVQ